MVKVLPSEPSPEPEWLVCTSCKSAVLSSHSVQCPRCGKDLSESVKHKPQDVKTVLHWYPK